MERLLGLWMMALLLMSAPGFGASYSVSTNTRGEAALDRATASGGSHESLTKSQVLQRFINASLQQLFDAQNSGDSRELDEKLKIASAASKQNARNALNAGINLPVVTDIPDQTNNVAQSPTIPIMVTDPDGLPSRLTATGLPPGMSLTRNAQDQPQITGTLTTAGTFNVTIHAFKHIFSDIQGIDTFIWMVNP